MSQRSSRSLRRCFSDLKADRRYFEKRLISIQNSLLKLVIHRLPLDGTLMSAAPHYGLRYGSVPATGNFQRLRGRPPLVSPLKSCMRRSFTRFQRAKRPGCCSELCALCAVSSLCPSPLDGVRFRQLFQRFRVQMFSAPPLQASRF